LAVASTATSKDCSLSGGITHVVLSVEVLLVETVGSATVVVLAGGRATVVVAGGRAVLLFEGGRAVVMLEGVGMETLVVPMLRMGAPGEGLRAGW
jgi:hypothetical protein